MLMRRYVGAIASLLIGATVLGPTKAALAVPAPEPATAHEDPMELYGSKLIFSVWRNGSKVGRHIIRFSKNSSGALEVDSALHIDVPFLMFSAYHFDYLSHALWSHGQMVRLRATINDNGTQKVIRARRDGTDLLVLTKAGRLHLPGDIFPTSHWNPGVIGASLVLNARTGTLNHITVKDLGTTSVDTATGPRLTRHFAYGGDVSAQVWYDMEGRWVRLQFPAKDGSTITYRCERCGPPAPRRRGTVADGTTGAQTVKGKPEEVASEP